jgi:hypothetical protein
MFHVEYATVCCILFLEIVVSMLMREGDGENHVKDAACP